MQFYDGTTDYARSAMQLATSRKAQRWWRRAARPQITRASWSITTRRVALGLVLVAGFAVLLDSQVSSRSAVRVWVPNVVIGALTAALTITVVEHALRNRDRSRDANIVSYIHEHLDLVLIDFGYALATDYGSSRLASFEPIPATLVDLCELWLEHRPDATPPASPAGQLPRVIASAENVATYLEDARTRYGFVVEKYPDLVNAIDRISDWVRVSRNQILGVRAAGWPSPESEAVMCIRVVSAMQQFFGEFSKLSPEPFWLNDDQRSLGQQMHERATATSPHSPGESS